MKVVFVGGAQALRLALAYSHRDGVTGVAKWIADRPAASPDKIEALRVADKIVWVRAGGSQPGLDAADLTAEHIFLPELQLDFLWPFAGQPHVANAPDDLYSEGPFPADLGDAWLNRALEGMRRPEAIEHAYLGLDVARCVDLDRMKDLALERQAVRDKRIGVDFATRIAESFRRRPLFFNPRGPGPEVFGPFVEAAFARLGVPYRGETAPATGRELPIHPSVAAHFGLDAAPPCERDWGERVDFAEYVRRYLAYSEGPELERGFALMAGDRFEEAVKALEIAAARPMGRRSHSARRGAARASLLAAGVEQGDLDFALDLGDPDYATYVAACARGRWRDAERALRAYLSRAKASALDFERLADVREKLGDAEGVFAALELAVGLAPDDRGLTTRLTLALAARGDLLAAARSAAREIALDPANPNPRVVLVALLIRAGWRNRAAGEAARALALIGDAPEHAALREALRARVAG